MIPEFYTTEADASEMSPMLRVHMKTVRLHWVRKYTIFRSLQIAFTKNIFTALDDVSQYINLELCDTIYELNEFEKCKVELHLGSRKFTGAKTGPFNNRIDVVCI